MVPASGASGSVGTRWSCGHRTVHAANCVSDPLRSVVWMLLQPTGTEEKEGWGDLSTYERD